MIQDLKVEVETIKKSKIKTSVEVPRYYITLSFRSLVVQTTRGLPAPKNQANKQFVCQSAGHGACVLSREHRERDSPWPYLQLAGTEKGY